MEKTFDHCNKCRKDDDSALIHCAVCAYPYHVKCVAPKLSVKTCDDLIANNNFHFYCDAHQSLCVHKLLNRISLLERKLRVCLAPLNDISNELDKHRSDLEQSGYNKSAAPIHEDQIVATPSIEVADPLLHPEIDGTSMHTSFSNITLRRQPKKRPNDPSIDHESPKSKRRSPTPTRSPDIDQRQEHQNAPTLKCLKPQRAVFLSGFETDTTVEDIKVYIEYYARTRLNINIRKMKFHVQSRSAVFVINVGTDDEAFELLCDPHFWPSHANCREYDFFRSRKRQQQDL